MPDRRYVTFYLTTTIARRADGIMLAVRCYHPKVADMWWWLNREADSLEELRPFRYGMFARRP